MRVEDGKVGGEHRRRDLATVAAVAYEGAGEARGFGREGELHGAAEAGRCRGVILSPTVVGTAGEGEVRLGFVRNGSHGGVFLDRGIVGQCGFGNWRRRCRKSRWIGLEVFNCDLLT